MWFSNRRAKFRREEKLRQQTREFGGATNYSGGNWPTLGDGDASAATNNSVAGSGLSKVAGGSATVVSMGAGYTAPVGEAIAAGGTLGLLQGGRFPAPLTAYGSFAYGLPTAVAATNLTANSFGEGFRCANVHIQEAIALDFGSFSFCIDLSWTLSSSMRLGGYNASAPFRSAAAAAYSQMLNFNVGQLANRVSNGSPSGHLPTQPANNSLSALHSFHAFQTVQSHARQFSETSSTAGCVSASAIGTTTVSSTGQSFYDAFSSNFLGGSYGRGSLTAASTQAPGTWVMYTVFTDFTIIMYYIYLYCTYTMFLEPILSWNGVL